MTTSSVPSLQDLCKNTFPCQIKFYCKNEEMPCLLDTLGSLAQNVILKGRFYGDKGNENPSARANTRKLFDCPISCPVFVFALKPIFEEDDEFISLYWSSEEDLTWWLEVAFSKENPMNATLKGRNVPLDTKLTNYQNFDNRVVLFRFDSLNCSWFWAEILIKSE